MVSTLVYATQHASKMPTPKAVHFINGTFESQLDRDSIKKTLKVVRRDTVRGIHHTATSIGRLLKTARHDLMEKYMAKGILNINGNLYYNARGRLNRL